MACDECRALNTHDFRSVDDMVHAVQTAAAEVDRGVLKRIGPARELRAHEQAAVDSAYDSGNVPGTIRYRFECRVCGDRFELLADTQRGTGGWRREETDERGEAER
jgi:hypothetical protein